MPNFDNVRGYLITHDIPAMYLEELHTKVISKKKKAMDMLGMNAENDYRISFEVNLTDNDLNQDETLCPIFDRIRSFILGRFPKTESISFCENRIMYKNDKNTYKLSKLLSGYATEINGLVGKYLESNDMVTHRVNESNIITDLFSLLKPVTLYLSGNTADIVCNSSEEWGNCYNPGNCHFSACTGHALDNFSFIVFTLRSRIGLDDYGVGRYAGRAWCHILPDKKFFLINKSYGAFNGIRRNATAAMIQHKFKESKAYTGEWQMYNDSYRKYNTSDSDVYFDGAYAEVIYGKPKSGRYDLPELKFKPSVCIACGGKLINERADDDEDSNRCLCYKCVDLKYCKVCKKIIPNNKMFKVHTASGRASSNDHICSPECADKVAIKCTKCGKHFINTDMVRSKSGVFCPTCYKNNFHKCCDCGDMFDVNSDQTIAIAKGMYLCKSCLTPAIKRGSVRKCDICGMIYTPDKKVKHNHKYCLVCINHSIVTCGKCGKDIVGDMAVFKWNGRWDTYCKDCDPKVKPARSEKKSTAKNKESTVSIKTCR